MTADQMQTEIREANLTYLMLAQNLIRADRAEALLRLGLSEEVADVVASLTPGQILKVAGSSMLMCRFRFDDSMVWNLDSTRQQFGSRSIVTETPKGIVPKSRFM